ncbi:MAG: peptidylprolyl isomerase, partial [Ruminococcus sp.]|nr:peptidylprolyl isomerase [Ruminococcus sp.]
MKLKKILTCMVSTMCAAIMTLSMVSCGNAHTKKDTSSSASSSSSKAESSESSENKVDDSKSFVIALYPEYAPETCANFEKLVKDGFYDGTTFHRVVEGFMAQGGSPTDPNNIPATIKGEFAGNGVDNKLSHTRGIVSMARGNGNDSASSGFFVCFDDSKSDVLDGRYAAFGEVVEGMEV